MNRAVASFLVLILALVLCCQRTSAQEQTAPATDKQAAATALRDKAYKLLDSLADQLSTLQSAENRARMGSNIADSLWTHDETKARALFELVEDDIKLGLQKPENDRAAEHTVEVFLKLRQDNVERIARHDPEMALTFLKETFRSAADAVSPPNGEIPRGLITSEHELELRLAKQIGLKNTNVTFELARKSLEHGLSTDLVPLVIRLNDKNKEQAQSLYKDIVQKIGDTDFDEYNVAAALTQRLIARFAPPDADVSTYKELVDIFLKRAFAARCDQPDIDREDERWNVCNFIGPVLPLIERYSPAQVHRLSRWAPRPNEEALPWVYWMDSEIDDVAENGTVDDLLQLATKHPDTESELYQRAIMAAYANGDAERAKKIADSYHGDPNIKRSLEMQIRRQAVSEEQLEQRLAEMEKYRSPKSPQGWAQTLLTLAQATVQTSPKFALKVLGQAEAMVNSLKPGEEQTRFQIQLAAAYCSVKDAHGFELMESLLPRLNDLVSAAVKLDGYDARYLRDGEWNMSADGSIGNVLTVLAGNAAYFAGHDFDRAVGLAGQFERSEIRMMAQLKLAQGVLTGPSRSRYTRSYYLY